MLYTDSMTTSCRVSQGSFLNTFCTVISLCQGYFRIQSELRVKIHYPTKRGSICFLIQYFLAVLSFLRKNTKTSSSQNYNKTQVIFKVKITHYLQNFLQCEQCLCSFYLIWFNNYLALHSQCHLKCMKEHNEIAATEESYRKNKFKQI